MFWDKAAKIYDLFDKVYNGKVNKKLVASVSKMINKDDVVLECACGTGMITKGIADNCKTVIATDYSKGMLKEAKKKLHNYDNVKLRYCNITDIRCDDNIFDTVVAGNVIHLLDNPEDAMAELVRVCKPGGKIIIPTYLNHENKGKADFVINFVNKLGTNFKKHYDYNSYKQFFIDMGYDAKYILIKGRMPAGIAVIINNK